MHNIWGNYFCNYRLKWLLQVPKYAKNDLSILLHVNSGNGYSWHKREIIRVETRYLIEGKEVTISFSNSCFIL